MKRLFAVAALLCLLTTFVPADLRAAASDKNSPQQRMLTGEVMDKSEAPLTNAVVYLKNTKTLTVKTFITDASGRYRFPALSPNVDYEVYAEHNGRKSDVKTLSSFDMRSNAQINLKIQ